MEFNNNGYNNFPETDTCRFGGGLGAQIPVNLFSGKIACEMAEDFTLPEYLPEIRRLLRVSSIVSVPSKYLAAASLKVSGTVDYNVLYVGSDGCVYSAELSDEYEMSSPSFTDVEYDVNATLSVCADVCVDNVVSRVTGARKINIKACVSANVKVIGRIAATGGSNISCEPHVQKLIKSCNYTTELFGESCDSEAVDELDIENGERYVSTDCRVFVEGVSAYDGYAECRGSVLMRHLMEKRSGKLYEIARKIPFDETVEIDGLAAGMPVTAFGRCAAITKNVTDDAESGAQSAVSVSAHICVAAKAYNKNSIRYVKDVFSTDYDCANEESSFELSELCACANKNLTLNESRDADSIAALTGVGEVIISDAVAEASVETVELSDNGRYVINGKCRFYVILARNDGEGEREDGKDITEYYSTDVEVPFRYECAESGEKPSAWSVRVEAIEPRVRYDGEKLDLGCEIVLSYSFESGKTTQMIENSRLGAEIKKEKKGYTVCYPCGEDSLWSISKKYRAKVDATARGNGIDTAADADSEELLEGIRYMIV